MPEPQLSLAQPRELARTLRRCWRLWVMPAAAGVVLSLIYVVLRGEAWSASQALVVRDEASSALERPGSFDSADALKSAQETIVDLARSRAVVEAALAHVGPADAAGGAGFPTAADVASLQGTISVKAPAGAELGTTEVLHLSVAARTRERAVALSQALCDRLELQLRELRDRKAASMIDESNQRVAVAEVDLAKATGELAALETEVGEDLGELRILNQTGAGDSDLRSTMNNIKTELRQARSQHEASQQLQQILLEAREDALRLVATPNRLLESQPALRRLKDGVVDAQLRTAELLGKMTDDHPQVRAARAAENEVRQHLRDELQAALLGTEAELRVSGALVESHERQLAAVGARLDTLATLRARYGNLVAQVERRGQILEKAQKDLSEARATRAAARATSLVTRLGGPVTGDRPVGPGKRTIVIGGLMGGLLAGLGLVFLTVTSSPGKRGRRWTDYLGFGRRASDRAAAPLAAQPVAGVAVGGRRGGDSPTAVVASVAAPSPSISRDRRQSEQNTAVLPPAEPAKQHAG